ncbi:hypothetical protein BN129_2765 [Cronobacter sakazakii 701]|nr:hypothetical protein BN129_2765 [Cronobacter sakazakii 701]
MVRRFTAYRVGVGRIAGQHKRLAAAAAEILLFFRAGAARLRHPVQPAVTVKAERLIPDMRQRLLQHRREFHRQLARAVARQRGALRRDGEENRAPAAHAAFRALFVIIRRHKQQVSEIAGVGHLLAVVFHYLLGARDLLAGRQQPFAVQVRPAVKLAGGELHVIRVQLNGELDNAVDLVDVVTVQHEVQHHRVAERFHRFRHRELLVERFFVARQRRVQRLVARLEAYLDMIQPGVGEGLEFFLGKPDAGRDQIGVKAHAAPRVASPLCMAM